MSFKEKVIQSLEAVGKTNDLNFNYLYRSKEYQDVLQFAKRYQNIAGVQEQIVQLQETDRQYRQQLNEIIDENYDKVNEKHHAWYKAYFAKRMLLRMAVIGVIACTIEYVVRHLFMSEYMAMSGGFLVSFIENVSSLALQVGLLGGIVFKICDSMCWKRYQSENGLLEKKQKR